MRTLDRRPALRWIAPVAAVALAGGGLLAATTAAAGPTLRPLSADQLVANVLQAKVSAMSGTVTETANLGLPSLPVSDGHDSVDFSSLISGTHTLKVWTSGADKSRVMLTGTFGESDLVRNGNSVWSWNSKAKTATHLTGSTASKAHPMLPGAEGSMPTPQEAAKQALQAIDSSTVVTVGQGGSMAGRTAYQLILTPKSTATLVGSVQIWVDSKTYLPLGVDVYPKATPNTAALSMDYSEVSFAKPADSTFDFTPPAGAKVTEKTAPSHGSGSTSSGRPGSLHGPKTPSKQQQSEARKQLSQDVKTYGDGWASVVVAKAPADLLGSSPSQSGSGSQADQWQQVLANLPTVQGKGWTGHAFSGTLFSLVVTDDNRVAVGAVPVDSLVADLG